MDIENRDVLIWLNMIGITNRSINKLMNIYNDLKEIIYLKNEEIYKIKGLRNSIKEKIIFNNKKDVILEKLEEANKYNIITIYDSDYPEKLKNIPDRPKVLYWKGNPFKKGLFMGIVGSRKSTDYGSWVCKKFTRELINLNMGIISGLALGIDTIAHREALKAGGYTVAVLGNGIDTIYPKRNEILYAEIEEKGTILTEYPPGTKPLSYNFPNRNRIISGLSEGIIVVEAKEKSGSLITANHALEQGKDIYAVPGNINSIFSSGTNKLIKDGAIPLMDIGDIIEEIPSLKENLLEKSSIVDFTEFSEIEIKIIKLLKQGPIHSDELVYKTGIDISSITTLLIGLELKGIIEEVSNNVFMLI